MRDPRPSIRSDKASDNFEKTHFCMLEFMSHREVCPTKTVIGRGRAFSAPAPLCEIDDGDMKCSIVRSCASCYKKRDTARHYTFKAVCTVALSAQPRFYLHCYLLRFCYPRL